MAVVSYCFELIHVPGLAAGCCRYMVLWRACDLLRLVFTNAAGMRWVQGVTCSLGQVPGCKKDEKANGKARIRGGDMRG